MCTALAGFSTVSERLSTPPVDNITRRVGPAYRGAGRTGGPSGATRAGRVLSARYRKKDRRRRRYVTGPARTNFARSLIGEHA
ncbi:hypothetical protein Kpho02_09870 [Kitasatospora phosalacinea]|uniref:Uncharacterized protein n=1 Tax=Kitasatospora phosalacinea TaxID=2065 RepID=A0A9W6UZX5_9ACTN|nr:hypothetical protein Kpho02_09870 [Kitasatospora phosalacinea]